MSKAETNITSIIQFIAGNWFGKMWNWFIDLLAAFREGKTQDKEGEGRRGAVVKRVEHISTIMLVNIWVAQVRAPLVLSVGIWTCKNSTINT